MAVPPLSVQTQSSYKGYPLARWLAKSRLKSRNRVRREKTLVHSGIETYCLVA
jgi:hypothetical protein